MKKIVLALLCAIMSSFAMAQQDADWANFGRYEQANKEVVAPVKVVFMGNSITDGWWFVHPEFFTDNGYLGRGIGGQVSSQMLVRFRSDVINHKPQAVVILAGTNDLAMNNGYISVDHTFENIVSMADLARANGIKPVLCSVLPAAEFPWRNQIDAKKLIKELNAKIEQYAKENKIPYVDYYTAMVDADGGLDAKYQNDPVHPNAEGYYVMEALVQKVLAKCVKGK